MSKYTGSFSMLPACPEGMMALTVVTAAVRPFKLMNKVAHWLGIVEPWMVAGGISSSQ